MKTKKIRIQARNNYVVIRLDDNKGPDESDGGIVIPEGARAAASYESGIVTSVGPDVTGFTEKDHVLIGMFAGQEVTIDGNKFRLMLDKDIFGVLV